MSNQDTIPTDTAFIDLADTLNRKISQLRDMCRTLSDNAEDPLSGTFCFLADSLAACEQLTSRVMKAGTDASQTATSPLTDGITIPTEQYNQLGLSIETLQSLALIASDQDVRENHTTRTIDGLNNAIVYEVDRVAALLSSRQNRPAAFKHRHGPDREQPQ